MCFLVYFRLDFQLFPLMARGHLLCPERQSKQNALMCHRSERSHNHRQSQYQLIYILPFLLAFNAIFGRCLSVIVPFLLSASRGLFSLISALRSAYTKFRRSSLLSPSQVNRLSRFAVSTSLPSFIPTFVGRCYVLFFGCDRVSLVLTDEDGSLW